MGLSSISSSDSRVNVSRLETGVLPFPVANLIQFRHFINHDNMLLTFQQSSVPVMQQQISQRQVSYPREPVDSGVLTFLLNL